jgi:geranylgeranylglycerol-phosphate geranylgeranyltransferase
MRLDKRLRAFIAITRPPNWLSICLLFGLWMVTFQKGLPNPRLMSLAILALASTIAGGFVINDYFDLESDAIVRPERPIPSKLLSPAEVAQFTVVLFLVALGVALAINPLAFGIVAFNTVFLILYPSVVKKYSGFLSNIILGLVEGITVPVFAEVVLFQRVSIVSLSFVGFASGVAGANVLQDVLSVEGDMKMGLQTLATKQGSRTAIKVGALLFLFYAIALAIPYVVGVVTAAYLIPAALLACIIFYGTLSLFIRPDVRNMEEKMRTYTIALLVLYPIALIVGTFLLR